MPRDGDGMHNKVIVICITLVVVIIAASCDSRRALSPQSRVHGNSLSGPEAVIKAFCALDAEGKRFSRSSSEEEHIYYQGLVDWTNEPDWDNVVIISSYKIGAIKKLQDAAEITVRYDVKGKYSKHLIIFSETIDKINFEVIKTETGWKIRGPIACPHMYAKTLITNLNNRIKDERDSTEKARIRKDINLIKNIKYFCFEKNMQDIY